MTIRFIERIEIPSGGAATATFSNIPDIYQDLYLRFIANSDDANKDTGLYITFNGSGTYRIQRLNAVYTGATPSAVEQETSFFTWISANSATYKPTGYFSGYIPNYKSSTTKTINYQMGTANNENSLMAIINGTYTDTSPISSITFDPAYGNLTQYSVFELYGIQ